MEALKEAENFQAMLEGTAKSAVAKKVAAEQGYELIEIPAVSGMDLLDWLVQEANYRHESKGVHIQ